MKDIQLGDLVFIIGSLYIHPHTPVIISDIFQPTYSSTPWYVVLNPLTGEKLEYQEHNISTTPPIGTLPK
jgi:hypothetical protein